MASDTIQKKDNTLLEQRDIELRKNIIQKILSTPGKSTNGASNKNKSLKYDTDYHCDSIDRTGVYED